MSHLNEGTLRRMLDEPGNSSAADSAHFASCEACRASADRVRAEASGVSALLAVPDPRVEPAVALLRVRRLAADAPPASSRGLLAGLRQRRAFRPVAATALALGLMAGLVATGVAEGVVQTFEPTQFTPVSVSTGSLNSLPDLSKFGTYKLGSQPTFRASTTADAALAGSGFSKVLVPSSPLPRDVTGQPQFETFGSLQGSFTISKDKASQYEASVGKTLPDMPKGMDGTTISVTVGPGVLTLYGAPSLAGADTATGPDQASAPKVRVRGGGDSFQMPTMAIVQMKTPKVNSDGASIQEMESYLASLPGVPADLAAQIKAIGDPTNTLPVPVPTGQGSHQVKIGSETGLFVGDSTGLGAGVIWQHNGVLYAVVGTLNEGDVVAVANGLH